jgi:hypothetical protein
MTTYLIGKEGIGLENISVNDVLFFPDRRIEDVTNVWTEEGLLYTERMIPNKSSEENNRMFPEVREKIVYQEIKKVDENSIGKVYAKDLISAKTERRIIKNQIKKMYKSIEHFMDESYK